MEGDAKKSEEGSIELANKTTTEPLYKVSTPCIDDHKFRKRIVIRGRLVRSMFTNCPEMSIFFTNWLAGYSMVSQPNLHVRSQNGPELVTLVCRV